jgi:plasmid stabilization system protein ParE
MRNLEITPLAESDVDRRAAYLELNRRGYGRRFFSAFEVTIERIVRSPNLYALAGSKDARLRAMRIAPIEGFANLLILFRANDERVQILRVVHGAQDNESMADDILPQ